MTTKTGEEPLSPKYTPKERYSLKVGEYRILRTAIIKHLLTFYDRVDYCTFVFYVEKWHCYHQTGNFQEMITQYLAWGISNYHRNNTAVLFSRLKNAHPLTQYSVLRDDINKI